jgi:hypothetical protein
VSQSPHDALFRFTFGKPENPAALIRSNLTDNIALRSPHIFLISSSSLMI